MPKSITTDTVLTAPTTSTAITTADAPRTVLRTIAPHFQRAINLAYDAEDDANIVGYIPTSNGAHALAAVLTGATGPSGVTGTTSRSHLVCQRAHILHAAYGSGKSLLALVLSALASNSSDRIEILDPALKRLARGFPREAAKVQEYIDSGQRLLPVVLSGDQGPLDIALIRALSQALARHGLGDLQPHSQFQLALDIIRSWEQRYPETYEALKGGLFRTGQSIEGFIDALTSMQVEALDLFEGLYTGLAAGAHFDRFAGPTLDHVFHSTAQALHRVGYVGLMVIWDEYGRYLEAKAGDAFRKEAALLQSFAELCNRSGPEQVHLVLITHRLLPNYADGLPIEYQQEWARIAERFRTHDVASDPTTAYRLIAEALETPDIITWQDFAEQHSAMFDKHTARCLDFGLFAESDDVTVRQQIVERAWPLHPLTVYALPRLAAQVAQNERTLFTFLAADEPGTLADHLDQYSQLDGCPLVGIDVVWDYFSEAVRADTKPGGTHAIWSGATYAMSRVDPGDKLASSIVKTLAVLLAVSELNTHRRSRQERVLPTTELIAWAVNASEEEVTKQLGLLVQRRAVIYRRADGFWNFTRGSDIDLDAEISAALDRRMPGRLQMRQVLERNVPPPFHLPRAYNLERRMTRFFWGLYRWPEELGVLRPEAFLKELGPAGYADGAVIYVLATTSVEREQALDIVRTLPPGRIVFVIPDQPLLISEPLRELFALRELQGDSMFMEQDERLADEVAFFIEDAKRRLEHALGSLINPNRAGATWWHEETGWRARQVAHQGTAGAARLISHLCERWFSDTPILNNELLNQQEPSGQQMRAAENVVDALLDQPVEGLKPDIGIAGQGPEHLIARTMLVRTGLVQPSGDHNWRLDRPMDNPLLGRIWDLIQGFLESAAESEQEVAALVSQLQLPPFGLRRGVLPVLLAAAMRHRLPVLTLRQNGKVVTPIVGHVFTALCHEPDQYTVELGPWDKRRATLWAVLSEQCAELLSDQERAEQPPRTFGIGLLRWLQAQPRYCRDTNQVSADAQRLRDLIRQAQRDPTRVFLHDLLELMARGGDDLASHMEEPVEREESDYRKLYTARLSHLMGEIAVSYQGLLYSLDRLALGIFAADASARISVSGSWPHLDGLSALRHWLMGLEKQAGHSLDTFGFSDQLAQRFVETVHQDFQVASEHFWDQLSYSVLGIHLHDWSDQSAESFRINLVKLKERVEQEVHELAEDEAIVELHLAVPNEGDLSYRFRPSELSPQGERILQNFKSTLEIAGRPLPPDERRQVVLALLHFVLEGSNSGADTKPKARSKRRTGK